MRKSLRLRLILTSCLWIGLALVAAGFAIHAVLEDFVERQFDEKLDAAMVAILASAGFDEDGRPTLSPPPPLGPDFDAPFSGWYWQIADAGDVRLKSRSLWTADLGAGAAGATGDVVSGEADGPLRKMLRVRRRDFTAPGGATPLRVTVAGPKAEIAGEMAHITPVLAAALACLGAGLALAVMVQVYFGLKPLDRLRADLRETRAGRKARLAPVEMTEIAPLAAEINALLDHAERVVSRARTHVGNLAHSLKTPLAVMANEVARPGRDPDGAMADSVARIRRTAQHHLVRARAAAAHGVLGAHTKVRPVIDDIADAMRRIHADRGIDIEVTGDDRAVFAGEQHDIEEMAGNLIDNACKWAARHIAVTIAEADGWVTIGVEDDGPGMDHAACAAAIVRGARLDKAPPGDGLGLAIVQDIAALYDGALDLGPRGGGGLTARLTLPALARTGR